MARGSPSRRRQTPGHRGGVVRREREVRLHCPRAVQEQTHCLHLPQRLQRRQGLRIGHVQRGHPPGHLARDAQGLAAGGQDLQVGALAHQRRRHRRAGRDEVLAVVQHQQEVAGAQGGRHGGRQRLAGFLAQAQGRGHALEHQRGIVQGRQLDQPHAVGIAAQQRARYVQRQARLATAAGPGEGQQTRGVQQPEHRGHGGCAAHETGQRHRQVVGAWGSCAGQRPGRRQEPLRSTLRRAALARRAPVRRAPRAPVRRPPGHRLGERLEGRALGHGEGEGCGQPLRGAALGPRLPPLQVLQAAGAQASPLGQALLRQAGAEPVLPQELPKGVAHRAGGQRHSVGLRAIHRRPPPGGRVGITSRSSSRRLCGGCAAWWAWPHHSTAAGAVTGQAHGVQPARLAAPGAAWRLTRRSGVVCPTRPGETGGKAAR
jgi:hypothetical protein